MGNFAYHRDGRIRVWGPNSADDNGRLIQVSDGWGAEQNAQESRSADVEVMVWVDGPKPDFESEWLPMHSQNKPLSFRTVTHSLGATPALVKVMVRDPSTGFIYEAHGAATVDDDLVKPFGGT